MKIPVSWLRDFVDVPGTPAEISQTMSLRGFAVEGIEPTGEDDAVIDFEVTANRPDCLSIMGMAREVATAYRLQVRRPVVRGREPQAPALAGPMLNLVSLASTDQGDIRVTLDAPELCPRYAAAVVDVTVGSSPSWLQQRLAACGVRPISNIVDVTNYVLLELGQPMHAFDCAKLAGPGIVVRAARDGESIRTLDGQMRPLSNSMLVIADVERPVAIAGVMGGAESEVSPATTTIVLESAHFDPLSVRRTSKTLGLKTEASTRFERGTDPRLPVTAMERACALLEFIGAGRARGTVIDRYPTRVEPSTLRLRRAKIAGLLGLEIPDADVERILESLGFALRDASDGWDITVPTRRVDVRREVDAIEEVVRHFGFDRVPVTFPPVHAAPPPPDPRITTARRLRSVLTAGGFFEAVTFGFIAESAAAPFAPDGDIVPIANPLSETFAVLRPSLVPGLVLAVAHNRRREQRDVRLFEIGARFSRQLGERRAVACAWTGAALPEHWSDRRRDVDFFDTKALAERIVEVFQLAVDVEPHREQWLVHGRSAALVVDGTSVGLIGQLVPAIAAQHGVPVSDPIYVLEIDLDEISTLAPKGPAGVTPLPRYPSITRDISILVKETLAASEIRRTIERAAPSILARVREFDRYQGKGIPDGQVSLSLRLTFRSADRTLTDAEVQHAMSAVLGALTSEHAAVQR